MQRGEQVSVPESVFTVVPNERSCLRIVRDIHWQGVPFCPYCPSRDAVANGRHQRRYQPYLCNRCRHIFNDKTGRIFQGSRYSLRMWFTVALMLHSHVSMRQISKRLKTSYELTFRMAKKLRESASVDLIARSNNRTTGLRALR